MRRLISSRRRGRADRGATAVLVAMCMVVLMGFAGLALDMGHAYWEKSQLQAGADTAALSVADACAKAPTSTACTTSANTGDATSIPRRLANSAANDGKSTVSSVALNVSGGVVTVNTAALEDGAPVDSINTWFGQVVGLNSISVSATSTARWGGPTTLVAKFPLAFSACEVDVTASANGQLQYFASHGISDKAETCHKGDSGQEIPGGFGWLKQEPLNSCSTNTFIGSWELNDSGNNFKSGCDAVLASWKSILVAGGKVVVLLPVFNKVDGTGYQISQYAAVEIKGWHFQNPNEYLPPGTEAVYPGTNPKYQNSDLGFVGTFIRYVFTDEDATPGGTPSPTGANIVKLSN